MMSNLITVTPQQQDNHIIYVCNETNAPYADLAQLSRIFPNVDSRTLRNRLESVQESLIKTAKVQTQGGLQDAVALYPASVVSDLAFEFDLPLAKSMEQVGAAVYMYGLVGYEITPTPSEIRPFDRYFDQMYESGYTKPTAISISMCDAFVVDKKH